MLWVRVPTAGTPSCLVMRWSFGNYNACEPDAVSAAIYPQLLTVIGSKASRNFCRYDRDYPAMDFVPVD